MMDAARADPRTYQPEAETLLIDCWQALHTVADHVNQETLPQHEAAHGPVSNAADFRDRLSWMNNNAAVDYAPESNEAIRRNVESIVSGLGLTV